jgi:hypothetical protein
MSDATKLLSQLTHEALAQRRELRLAVGAMLARGIRPQVRQLPLASFGILTGWHVQASSGSEDVRRGEFRMDYRRAPDGPRAAAAE